ncbi:hypothetical protein N7532_011892 [Penicillium argentinense]|uniref:alpha-1,2-Mannosidase n=1 Tax=Penicillium argentinense TaxID=1131581 RepID=A0A9W9EJB1_9EURO|nr:uncharacterized protein N7532_011892 [Penicillium argentinense]KAJ5082849.1 hypothetical protein N7532_011892 [Penicillium argentinense]
MLRARRYRVQIAFAAIFVLAFFHFTRSRDWTDTVVVETPQDQSSASAPVVPNPNSYETKQKPPSAVPAEDASKYAPFVPHDSSPGSTSSAEEPQKPKQPIVSSAPLKEEPKEPAQDDTANSVKEPLKVPSYQYGAGADTHNKPPASYNNNNNNNAWQNAERPSSKLDAEQEEAADDDARYQSTVGIAAEEITQHWKKFPETYPVAAADLIKLPKGPAKSIPKLQAKFKDESSADKQERLQQLSAIKAEFVHAWQGYKKNAMGADELKPLSGQTNNPFMGWGATLVDALDSLWIMDLKSDFSEAVDEIKKIDFTTSAYRNDIPVFETVIRYLGGLLGAYDISGQRYPVLLEKAEELAEILMDIFDTPNRMPELYYRWVP